MKTQINESSCSKLSQQETSTIITKVPNKFLVGDEDETEILSSEILEPFTKKQILIVFLNLAIKCVFGINQKIT